MGSFSRVEKTSDKSSYELHGSGDLHIGRVLHNRRFDFAMVVFLDCLRQIIEYVKCQDPTVDFHHQWVFRFFATIQVAFAGELVRDVDNYQI